MASSGIFFNPYSLPPGTTRTTSRPFSVPQAEALCKALLTITTKRRGCAFFYPNEELDQNQCRFDWNYRFSARDYRVIVHFTVRSSGVTELFTIVSLHSTVASGLATCDPIPETVTLRLFQKIDREVDKALASLSAASPTRTKVFFYDAHAFVLSSPVRLGPHLLLPTAAIPRGDRIGAILIRLNQSSQPAQDAHSVHLATLFCALKTLIDRNCSRIRTDVKLRRGAKRFLDSESPDPARLYPSRMHIHNGDNATQEDLRSIEEAWDGIERLDPSVRKEFLDALFAHHGAKDIELRQGTLAGVGYLASLLRLAHIWAGRMDIGISPGNDRNLLNQMIAALFQLSHGKKEKVRVLLARFYAEQRSAFVHSGALRHDELKEKCWPIGMPSDGRPIGRSHTLDGDLRCISELSRSALLAFLKSESNPSTYQPIHELDLPQILIDSRATLGSRVPHVFFSKPVEIPEGGIGSGVPAK